MLTATQMNAELKWLAWPKCDRQKMKSKNLCMRVTSLCVCDFLYEAFSIGENMASVIGSLMADEVEADVHLRSKALFWNIPEVIKE
jgi:hypothetical protein